MKSCTLSNIFFWRNIAFKDNCIHLPCKMADLQEYHISLRIAKALSELNSTTAKDHKCGSQKVIALKTHLTAKHLNYHYVKHYPWQRKWTKWVGILYRPTNWVPHRKRSRNKSKKDDILDLNIAKQKQVREIRHAL